VPPRGQVFADRDDGRARRKRQRARTTLRKNARPQATAGSNASARFALLERLEGATVAELQKATGWQPHSVRGFLAGTVKKKLGLEVVSSKEERGRIYRTTRK